MKQYSRTLLFMMLASFAVADSAVAVGDGPGLVNVGTGQVGPPVATSPSDPPPGDDPSAGIYNPALGTFTPHQMQANGIPGWWVWTNKDGVNQWSFVQDPHLLGRKEWNGGGNQRNSANNNPPPESPYQRCWRELSARYTYDENAPTDWQKQCDYLLDKNTDTPPGRTCVPSTISCSVCKGSTFDGKTTFTQACSDGCQTYTQACLPVAPTLSFTGSYGSVTDQENLTLPSGGGSVELTWSTTNATPGICDASWVGGSKETQGSSSQTVAATKTFTLECWNTSVSPRVSTGQKSVVVTVTGTAATDTGDTNNCVPTYTPCTAPSNNCGMSSVGRLNSCTGECSARTPSNSLCVAR